MAIRVSSAVALSTVDAMTANLNIGAGTAAKLQVYSGARPTNIDDAIAAQVLLVEYDLPDPVFDAAVTSATGATATAAAIATEDALATGTAAWYRAVDKDGAVVIDGTVTIPSGDGDMKISSTAITSGVKVAVVSWTISARAN